MKRLLVFLCAVTLVLGIAGIANATLLTNGDAETCDLSEWTTDYTGATSGNTSIINAVMSQVQSMGTVYPYQGDWFFSFANEATSGSSNSGETISMYQKGSSGLGAPFFKLSGYYQTEATDSGVAFITFYDSSGTGIISNTGLLINNNWTYFALTAPVPTGAASWAVELKGTVYDSSWTNVFYDDVQLDPVPEPATMLLLGSGLLGLAGLSRKKFFK